MQKYERQLVNVRRDLQECFQQALMAVNGAVSVERFLQYKLQHKPTKAPVYVIALGKAASSMAEGAQRQLGGAINRGLIVTKHGHCKLIAPSITCIEADHPIPGVKSLQAGRVLLKFISEIPDKARVLILLSGGCSALVEVLPHNISLQQLQKLNQYLLADGMDIGNINRIRKQVSLIKGGRLAAHLKRKKVTVLAISDVKFDVPQDIGSGMLVPNDQISNDLQSLSKPVRNIIKQIAELPAHNSIDLNPNNFNHIDFHIVANLQCAILAIQSCAKLLGYRIVCHDNFLEGEAAECGKVIAEQLIKASPGLYIWGGETTVTLPDCPGRGGRNQTLALAAAKQLEGNPNCCLLAAGTDGSDGVTQYTGAIVDGNTVRRGYDALGSTPSVDNYLQNADVTPFLEAARDVLHTGPTGTNVMDLVIGVKI